MSVESDVFAAIAAGDAEQVRGLAEQDPSVATRRDVNGVSALLQARYRWREDLVEILLAGDPELNVFEAAALGRTGRVAELVEQAPELVDSVAPDGFTPLQLASFFGHRETVEQLLEHGADVALPARNDMAVMPLHAAAASNQNEVARLLLANGAPVNARQQGGYTPLHSAAANGNVELVRLLLEHGADATAQTAKGQSARDLARERGHDELVRLLT